MCSRQTSAFKFWNRSKITNNRCVRLCTSPISPSGFYRFNSSSSETAASTSAKYIHSRFSCLLSLLFDSSPFFFRCCKETLCYLQLNAKHSPSLGTALQFRNSLSLSTVDTHKALWAATVAVLLGVLAKLEATLYAPFVSYLRETSSISILLTAGCDVVCIPFNPADERERKTKRKLEGRVEN